jgi:hypothetical protein
MEPLLLGAGLCFANLGSGMLVGGESCGGKERLRAGLVSFFFSFSREELWNAQTRDG